MCAEIMAGIGVGVGAGTAYSFLSDLLGNGITYAKWKALATTMGKPLIANVLQRLLDSAKDPVTGLTTQGQVDTIFDFIDKTMDFSWIAGQGVSQALFNHMINQSVAYAIHTSHAGAVGTVCNVYSGSASMTGSLLNTVGANADLMDRSHKAFLSASAGQNVPTMASELHRGVNTRIDVIYTRVMRQVDMFTDEWNSLALNYYRQYHTLAKGRFQDAIQMFESVTNKAYDYLDTVAKAHLARISEQFDTLEGAKAWFDSDLMSSDEIKQISIRVNIEREASESIYDDYVTELISSISENTTDWDNKIDIALADMAECENRYALFFQGLFADIFNDVTDLVSALCDEVTKTIEDVCAYRNMKQSILIEPETALGSFEHSPETEVYRCPRHTVQFIQQYTVIKDSDAIRSVAWSEYVIEEGVEVATTLPIRSISVAESSTIVRKYTQLRDLAWTDAGNC
jgi:hypothetical protein